MTFVIVMTCHKTWNDLLGRIINNIFHVNAFFFSFAISSYFSFLAVSSACSPAPSTSLPTLEHCLVRVLYTQCTRVDGGLFTLFAAHIYK